MSAEQCRESSRPVDSESANSDPRREAPSGTRLTCAVMDAEVDHVCKALGES